MSSGSDATTEPRSSAPPWAWRRSDRSLPPAVGAGLPLPLPPLGLHSLPLPPAVAGVVPLPPPRHADDALLRSAGHRVRPPAAAGTLRGNSQQTCPSAVSLHFYRTRIPSSRRSPPSLVEMGHVGSPF